MKTRVHIVSNDIFIQATGDLLSALSIEDAQKLIEALKKSGTPPDLLFRGDEMDEAGWDRPDKRRKEKRK